MKYNDTAERAILVADIGGTHIQLGHVQGIVVNQTIKRISSDCLRTKNPAEVLQQMFKHYALSNHLKLGTVVLGIPGLLDSSRQSITLCNNIRQLEGTGLKDQLSSSLGCDVYLEQDIMLQVLGEWRSGAALNSDAVFGVYFGTGIGTAYLQEGDPFRRGGGTLQAGHIPVSNQGKPCICGNTDCVETFASGHTLVELADNHSVPVETLFTTESNEDLKLALDEFIKYQAFLLATVITITEPDMILIGGGIPQMQGYPRIQLEKTVLAHLQKPFPAEYIKLRWAEFEHTAALHGALALLNISNQQKKA